jgi:hypothetical protein
MDEQIPTASSLETGDALLPKAIDGLWLRPCGDLQMLRLSIEQRDLHVDTEGRFGESDTDPMVQIVTDPFKTVI